MCLEWITILDYLIIKNISFGKKKRRYFFPINLSNSNFK
jgi:hypothetical protein